jgi:drug/metabolite transporter (DMT)-like permease
MSKGQSQSRVSLVIIAYLVIGMALFGTSTPLSKIISQEFPIFTASLARMVIAALVLAPFLVFMTRRFAGATAKDWIVMGAIAAAGMVGFTAAMLYGMRLTTGVIGSTIMSAAPAITAIGAVIFFGAAMNWRKGGALAMAIAGVVLINLFVRSGSDQGSAILLGSALVALAVHFEAAYTLLSRKLSDGITSLEATFGATLMAIPIFAALALLFDAQPFDFSSDNQGAWAALLFWGAASGGLAPILWYQSVRQAPGGLTAGAMCVMPLSALVLSYWLLGESFAWLHMVGFGLVFAGLLLIVREHMQD